MKNLMYRYSRVALELTILAFLVAYPLNKYLSVAPWIDSPLVLYFVWALFLILVFRWLSMWFAPRFTMHEVVWVCGYCLKGDVYYSTRPITDLDNDEQLLSMVDQGHGIECSHEDFGVTMYTFPSAVTDLPVWFQLSAWGRLLKLRKLHAPKYTPAEKESGLGVFVRYLKKLPLVMWTTSFAAAGMLTVMFPGTPVLVRLLLIPFLTVFIAAVVLVLYIDSSPVLKTDEAVWHCPSCSKVGIVELKPSGNNHLWAKSASLLMHDLLHADSEKRCVNKDLKIYSSSERVVDLPASIQFSVMTALAKYREPKAPKKVV
jgi:hypothetical protein